mgnify:CR=1 FL=1
MKTLFRGYLDASLILRVTIALVLGVVVGLIGGETVAGWLAPFGDLLLRLLQFLIVPIVLFTLIVGINQADLGRMGRIGGKVFGYYVASSAMAIVVGLAVASLFSPGSGMTLDDGASVDVPENPGLVSVLLSIVPDNIVGALAEPNLLGIIFTAFVFGIALLKMRHSEGQGELGEKLYGVIEGLNAVTMKVMAGVLQYVPIGVFAIVAGTVARQGKDTILSLGTMVIVLYLALAMHLVLYCVLMKAFGVRLKAFFREARTPMATAFATQSSTGTLPLTLNAAQRLGISRSLYGFSLPLGATINMDGTALYQGVIALFAAQAMGTPMTAGMYLTIILMATLVSIGTAGIPSVSLFLAATTLSVIGATPEQIVVVIAVLFPFDRILDMMRTVTNVTGDLTVATAVAKWEGELDEEIFRARDPV